MGGARRWAVLALGAIAVIVGATLVTRPFQSLAVLILLVAAGLIVHGAGMIANRDDGPDRRLTVALGLGSIAAGAIVLLWPGLPLRGLALVVGLFLLVTGIARLVGALRGTVDERARNALLGAAAIVLGALAIGWPDITTLVVGIVFGVWLVVSGLGWIVDAIRGRAPGSDVAGRPGRLRRWGRTILAAGLLVVALLLGSASLSLHAGSPEPDGFYTPPADIPATPGTLLLAEPFERAIPDGARAWRILYTTTRDDQTPAVASALVVAPATPPANPSPVIAWAHGTTGVAEGCAPSLLKDPFAAGAMPALDSIVDNGWTAVATDYIGLGTEGPHAYLVGPQAGRAVLDAARAARQLRDLTLDDRTIVWGHSQGGNTALWTGIVAPGYAPDAQVIGVAALAPASNLVGLVGNLDVVPGGALFGSFVIQGYSDWYDDVRFNDYVRPTAQVVAREMASRCLAEPEVFVSILTSFIIDKSIWAQDPTGGPFGARLAENVPSGAIEAPLLLGQGLDDELVVPEAQDAYVAARCEAGYPVDYRTYEGFDHVGVVGPDSPLVPDLLAWTQDRLDGAPPASTCGP
jgi:uncharacterized membrane protein HdeD (DUF308 family)/alpha-beta hydrolase superfamily lysophospholipase